MPRRPSARCRCGSGRTLHRCCGPWLAGAPAPSPEALMRSRFTAYAKGRVDYILATTEPDSPAWHGAPDWPDQIRRFCVSTRFERLEVLDAPPPDGDTGFVTFRAALTQQGEPSGFSERSRFVRRDGVWRYHSGERLSG